MSTFNSLQRWLGRIPGGKGGEVEQGEEGEGQKSRGWEAIKKE